MDLQQAARGNIRNVVMALHGTGIRLDSLLAKGGQGGPFVPVVPGAGGDVERWDRLSRVVRALPLAAPLEYYRVSSGFGRRMDPVRHRRAMHEGIDLLAPPRSPVLSTAPGRVVFAGWKGGFGRMVEIDHGLGVRTRYAHLAIIRVHAGQSVALRQTVGLLGSSGRSTGPHLHYEVLVDDHPRNPDRFLRAGMRLSRAN